MNTTPFPEDSMHNIIITPDEHPGHHFRRASRFPRAPHHNARQSVSMRDLTSTSSMISEARVPEAGNAAWGICAMMESGLEAVPSPDIEAVPSGA